MDRTRIRKGVLVFNVPPEQPVEAPIMPGFIEQIKSFAATHEHLQVPVYNFAPNGRKQQEEPALAENTSDDGQEHLSVPVYDCNRFRTR
jgi:hypothetical protein